MSPGRLRERARIGEEWRNAWLSARRVIPIDEEAEGIQRDVLGESHPEREPARVSRDASAYFVEREPEQGTVERVHYQAGRSPAGSASDSLAEHGDVRVVAAEHSPVERFLQRPNGCGRCSGGSGSQSACHVASLQTSIFLYVRPEVSFGSRRFSVTPRDTRSIFYSRR
jgi:hypothetical protein